MRACFVLVLAAAAILPSCASHEAVFDQGPHGEGTVSPIERPKTNADLVGAYSYCDGFWTWEINLRASGDFLAVHLTDTGGTEVDAEGEWTLSGGSTVILQIGKQECAYEVLQIGSAPCLVEKPGRHLGDRYYRRVYDRMQSPVLTETHRSLPNQSADRMPGGNVQGESGRH